MIEDLKNLIDNSALPTIQKRNFNRFIDNSYAENQKQKEVTVLICSTDKSVKLVSEIVLLENDIVIYKDGDNYYRFIFKVGDIWKTSNTICPNFQLCYLSYLQEKHLGQSSEFVYFVTKMLSKNENL